MAPVTLDSQVLDDLLRRLGQLERQVAQLTQIEVSTVGENKTNVFSENQAIRRASNASLQVGVDANNYFEVLGVAAGYAVLRQIVQSGNSLIDIEPRPLDGSSPANFRFFRGTNTTGQCSFDVLIGNNTNTFNARISGKGSDTFFCANNGNLGVGAATTPAQRLDVTGNARVRGFLQLTDGATAPSAASGFGAIYIDSADGDLKVRFGDGVTKTLATDT